MNPENDSRQLEQAKQGMIDAHLVARGITDSKVLAAMESVPREEFVTENFRDSAYEDHPLPIGYNQTISQPYIVAYMTELLRPKPKHRVLEIGSGCGYQAAILAQLVNEVHTVEVIEELAKSAKDNLTRLNITNVHVHHADGTKGWPDAAPYDGILAACAPEETPGALIDQLAVGGRLIIPTGAGVQQIRIITKTEDGIEQTDDLPVRFVPMRSLQVKWIRPNKTNCFSKLVS